MLNQPTKTSASFRLSGEDSDRGAITVTAKETTSEKPLVYWEVDVDVDDDSRDCGGLWQESFGSREQLEAFLLGLKVMCTMSGGRFPIVEIPG